MLQDRGVASRMLCGGPCGPNNPFCVLAVWPLCSGVPCPEPPENVFRLADSSFIQDEGAESSPTFFVAELADMAPWIREHLLPPLPGAAPQEEAVVGGDANHNNLNEDEGEGEGASEASGSGTQGMDGDESESEGEDVVDGEAVGRRNGDQNAGSAPQFKLQALWVFGYAVWSSEQLLSEIARGSWGLCRSHVRDVLHSDGALWARVWDERCPLDAHEDALDALEAREDDAPADQEGHSDSDADASASQQGDDEEAGTT